jgi:DNA-binding transcriptional ArsR family regulator
MLAAGAVSIGCTLRSMAVVITLQGVVPADVAVGLSPLAELMACLHSVAEPEHHLDVRPWLERVNADLSAESKSLLAVYAPLWNRRRCRVLLPLEPPLGRTLEQELARLEALPLDDFVTVVAPGVHGGVFDTRDLLTDESVRSAYVLSSERRSFSRGELARRLLQNPQQMRAGLLELLRRCAAEFFDAEWARVQHRLESECTRVRARIQALSLPEALASLSPNAVAGQNPPAVVFDKLQSLRADPQGRRCLLVPSAHARPHLIVKDDPPYPVVVHFPVERTDSANPAERATLAQVRLRLAILSEPARLELCRHLVNEPITTSDLSVRTGMTSPQVSRHLGRLREAGLLTSRRDGRQIYHRLDTNCLMHLGVDVLTSIIR